MIKKDRLLFEIKFIIIFFNFFYSIFYKNEESRIKKCGNYL